MRIEVTFNSYSKGEICEDIQISSVLKKRKILANVNTTLNNSSACY